MTSLLTVGGTALITADSMAPLVTAITENVTALLPIGLGIMGVIISVTFVPKMIKKFF